MNVAPEGSLEGVSKEVAEWLLERQKRCVDCGSTNKLEIHHRIPRGEGEVALQKFLKQAKEIYESTYGVELVLWSMHSVQNLVVLCKNCHEKIDLDMDHRNKYRVTFTCPKTGFNIPFQKQHASFISS